MPDLAVRRRWRRSPDQADLRGAGRRHGGRPERDRRRSTPQTGSRPALAPRTCSRTGRSRSTSTTRTRSSSTWRTSTSVRTRATGPSSSPTTCSSAAAASTRARTPNAYFLHNKDVPQQTALPYGTQLRDVPQPGSDLQASTLDGVDTSQVAPHTRRRPTGTPATRARATTSSMSTRGRRRRHGRLLDLVLHRGRLGLRLRRGPRRQRVGHRPARRRQRHRRSRRTTTRTTTTPRATASPVRRAARTSSMTPMYIHLSADAPRWGDRRPLPLLDRRGVPRHRLVRGRRPGQRHGRHAQLRPTATGSRRPASQDNNWILQIVSSCDLTPGTDVRGRDAGRGGLRVSLRRRRRSRRPGSRPSA